MSRLATALETTTATRRWIARQTFRHIQVARVPATQGASSLGPWLPARVGRSGEVEGSPDTPHALPGPGRAGTSCLRPRAGRGSQWFQELPTRGGPVPRTPFTAPVAGAAARWPADGHSATADGPGCPVAPGILAFPAMRTYDCTFRPAVRRPSPLGGPAAAPRNRPGPRMPGTPLSARSPCRNRRNPHRLPSPTT